MKSSDYTDEEKNFDMVIWGLPGNSKVVFSGELILTLAWVKKSLDSGETLENHCVYRNRNRLFYSVKSYLELYDALSSLGSEAKGAITGPLFLAEKGTLNAYLGHTDHILHRRFRLLG